MTHAIDDAPPAQLPSTAAFFGHARLLVQILVATARLVRALLLGASELALGLPCLAAGLTLLNQRVVLCGALPRQQRLLAAARLEPVRPQLTRPLVTQGA